MSDMSEYKSSRCKLTGQSCDKTCELWMNCPLEKHDVSDYEFINEVIEYVKKKRKVINEKDNG